MSYEIKARPKTYPKQGGRLVTFAQYQKMISESEKADLIDGQVIRDAQYTQHGRIVSWFVTALTIYVEKLDLGEVFTAPLTVRLSDYQGPQPDVLFVSKKRSHIIGEKWIKGPPDLCIEVISKSSRSLDRRRKFDLYAEYGVAEYWVVDPIFYQTIEFFENRAGGFVKIQPGLYGRLHSKVLPGFWLEPEWVIGGEPVPVLEIMEKIFKE